MSISKNRSSNFRGFTVRISAKSHSISANIMSVILLGLSKGIILGSMTVVALDMLGSSRLSTGMGIMGCVNGTITAAIGPLHGNVSSVHYVHTSGAIRTASANSVESDLGSTSRVYFT